jgi:hypothetical protein
MTNAWNWRENIMTARELRSLAGSLNFIAGVVHPLRPFPAPLWAALSSRKTNEWSQSQNTRRRNRLPRGLIEVRQCKQALAWIIAFLNKQRGTISRIANYNEQPAHKRRVSVDASAWGIGGILRDQDIPISYFADDVADHDLLRYGAMTGGPAFNKLWEALAILVALRAWRNANATSVTFQVRSDCLSASSSI